MQKLKLWVFTFIFFTSAATFSLPHYTQSVTVNFVHFANSDWSQSLIDDHLQEAQQIYDQCGVRLSVGSIKKVSTDNSDIYFDLEGYTDHQTPHSTGALKYADLYSDKKNTTLFFFQSFDPEYGHISATAMPAERITQPDQRPALNTVWLTYRTEQLRKPFLIGPHDGYSILAHEIGHVLLNTDHVETVGTYNLMHGVGAFLNGRLTLSQCEQIKKSPLVEKMKTDLNRDCQIVKSPLIGSLFFLNQSSRPAQCQLLRELTDYLARTQDEISDLLPAHSVDTYIFSEPTELKYLDRHFFEARLPLTYDQAGQIELTAAQQKTLWLHELGHGILNAQLKADWLWFNQRQQIMEDWGRAVTESTRLELLLRQEEKPEKMIELRKKLQTLEKTVQGHIARLSSNPDIQKHDDLLAPYHEFFADAVVLLATEDSRALRTALSNPQDPSGLNAGPEERKEFEYRDYSILRPLESWQETEAHWVLVPTLALWWKKTQPELRTRSKAQLLREFYTQVMLEVLERVAQPTLHQLSTREINERMMRRLGVGAGP